MPDLSRDTTLDPQLAPGLATDSAVEVLGFVRDQKSVADAAEANLLRAAVQWGGHALRGRPAPRRAGLR